MVRSQKNSAFWVMLFIVALGTVLRLVFIDKPEGLWNDEYVSWSIAVIPFGKKFVDAVLSQCHMPFYYLYLKFFIHFYGNSDLMLRMTSVLPGILAIISMCFVGKELKDERLGILCAAMAALSSFLIYYSQEVRFYELLFLFASWSLLYTLKLGKEQNAKNLILYILSNFLIIVTHTIGFIFVFFNLVFLSLWLQKQGKHKNLIVKLWASIGFLSVGLILFCLKIFTTHPLSQWWSHFSVSNLAFLVTDYFSPILTNLVSAPSNFFYNFSLNFIIFAIIPSLIAIAGIVMALKSKKYEMSGLFFVSLAFVAVMILMSVLGKLVFITKYSMEIYPILILMVAFGLSEFKKGWRYFLIFLFCFLNLFYILMNPNSAPKLHRWEGHKIVAQLLKNSNLNQGDTVLINYYPKDRFEKYFNFNKYNVISINKGTFSQYLGLNQQKLEKNKDKNYLKPFVESDNRYFENKLDKEVIAKVAKKQKLAIVFLNSVAMYSPVQMEVLLSSDKDYNQIPYPFLVFSYLKNKELEVCLKELRISRFEQKGSWAVAIFERK